MPIDKVMTPKFRASFPCLITPRKRKSNGVEKGEAKYSITMLFPKSTDLTGLKALVHKARVSKWGEDKAKWPKELKMPFLDGDSEKYSSWEGYKGHWFVRASTKMKPGVIDRDKTEILTEDVLYAGCYARATVNAFPYDQDGNRGVAFGIQNVQKLEDGTPFSGRTSAQEDFDVYGDGPAAAAKDDFDDL